MSAPAPRAARFKARNLLGVLAFLRKYPFRVTICLSLLLLIVGLDLSIPQFIGDGITGLRRQVEDQTPFSPALFVQIVVSLVLIRTGFAYLLGAIRNRTIQSTLADIRAAMYDAMQRLPFAYHDKAN